MTMTQLLILVAILCIGAIVAGIGLLTSLPWALIAAGIIGLVGVVVLYDPAAKKRH
jgi:hypothetical protein